jgi:predicted transcriptional regulator
MSDLYPGRLRMKSELERVTEMELALLKLLWEWGKATIRELTVVLYPTATAPQYATVQKLLERLEAKGYVSRDRNQRAHRFGPTVTQEEFLGGRLQALADKLCGGSLTPLLTTLVRVNKMTALERTELRRLIRELGSPPRVRRGSSKRKG